MVKPFKSSVQREFEKAYREIAAYIRQDEAMGHFVEPSWRTDSNDGEMTQNCLKSTH